MLNKEIVPNAHKIFLQLQLNETLVPSKLPKFRIEVLLIGKMSGTKPRGAVIEKLWKSEISSAKNAKVAEDLFGMKPPLPPVISSELENEKV